MGVLEFFHLRPTHLPNLSQCVNVEGAGMTGEPKVIQWTSAVQPHGQWAFIPTGVQDEFYIVARHSGLFATCWNDYPIWTIRQTDLWDEDDIRWQRFLRKQQSPSHYSIRTQRWHNDGGAWDIYENGFHNGARVIIWKFHGDENQIFKFNYAFGVTYPDPQPGLAKPYQIGPPPKLTTYDQPVSPESPPVLIGEILVPYFLVNDSFPFDSKAHQLNNSPYYILSRYNLWRLVKWYHHDGKVSYTHKVERTVGFSTEQSQSFEKAVKLTLVGSSELLLKTLTLILGPSIEANLKATTTTTWKKYGEEKEHHEWQFPALKMSHAFWQMVDRYVLSRGQGSQKGEKVKTWDELPKAYFFSDTFPSAGALVASPENLVVP